MRVLVLLLPVPLEDFPSRDLVDDLRRSPAVVVVDPPRASYASLARVPDFFGLALTAKQAKRLRKRLPGPPRAVAIFHAAQYPLARAMLGQIADCELWYGRTEPVELDPRLQDLHDLAAGRAALTFTTDAALASEEAVLVAAGNAGPLWDRLARLLEL